MNPRVFSKTDPRKTMDVVIVYFFLILFEVTHGLGYGGANNLQPYMWVCALPLFCSLCENFCRCFLIICSFLWGELKLHLDWARVTLALSEIALLRPCSRPYRLSAVPVQQTSVITNTSILWFLKNELGLYVSDHCVSPRRAGGGERNYCCLYETLRLNAVLRFLQISMCWTASSGLTNMVAVNGISGGPA